MNIIYYKTSSGREPVLEYLQQLSARDQEEVAVDFKILFESGIMHPSLITRKLKGKLWEIKTGTRHQQRIFYCLVSADGIVLLHECKIALISWMLSANLAFLANNTASNMSTWQAGIFRFMCHQHSNQSKFGKVLILLILIPPVLFIIQTFLGFPPEFAK